MGELPERLHRSCAPGPVARRPAGAGALPTSALRIVIVFGFCNLHSQLKRECRSSVTDLLIYKSFCWAWQPLTLGPLGPVNPACQAGIDFYNSTGLCGGGASTAPDPVYVANRHTRLQCFGGDPALCDGGGGGELTKWLSSLQLSPWPIEYAVGSITELVRDPAVKVGLPRATCPSSYRRNTNDPVDRGTATSTSIPDPDPGPRPRHERPRGEGEPGKGRGAVGAGGERRLGRARQVPRPRRLRPRWPLRGAGRGLPVPAARRGQRLLALRRRLGRRHMRDCRLPQAVREHWHLRRAGHLQVPAARDGPTLRMRGGLGRCRLRRRGLRLRVPERWHVRRAGSVQVPAARDGSTLRMRGGLGRRRLRDRTVQSGMRARPLRLARRAQLPMQRRLLRPHVRNRVPALAHVPLRPGLRVHGPGVLPWEHWPGWVLRPCQRVHLQGRDDMPRPGQCVPEGRHRPRRLLRGRSGADVHRRADLPCRICRLPQGRERARGVLRTCRRIHMPPGLHCSARAALLRCHTAHRAAAHSAERRVVMHMGKVSSLIIDHMH